VDEWKPPLTTAPYDKDAYSQLELHAHILAGREGARTVYWYTMSKPSDTRPHFVLAHYLV
jgi:hypothetical protein